MEIACIGGFLAFIFVYIAYQLGHSRGYWRGYFDAIRERMLWYDIEELEDE